jgi:Virulence-associated protein E
MTKPNKIEVNLENFPAALAPLCKVAHWVLWRWEQRKGKWTKPPFMATHPRRKAKNNDPATWASYETAVGAAKEADGIGFALLDTPFVAVDLDHCLDGDEIDSWAKALVDAANGAYIERTPSGEGLRIIGIGSGEKLHRKWKIDGAREGAAIEVYRGCERYITVTGAQLGDCKELSQLDLLDKITTDYDNKKKSSGSGFDFNNAGASIDYDEIIRSGAPAGADVSAVFHATIGHLSAKGLSVDKIVEELSKWPNGIARRYASRLRGEVERSFEKWQSKRKIHSSTTATATAEPDEPLIWEATDKNGKPLATCANARRALLALGVECRFDVFHDKHIIEGPIVLKLANLDLVVADLRRKIHAAFGFDPGKHNTIDAVEQLCAKNKFNPIVDYLDALKWDGTPGVDRWLITYLGAEDNELNREFGRIALIAGVRRARKPGTKFDPIIVLEGPMGSRKSMAIETMAGTENFSDQTILGARDREVQELLAGVWLYEIAELSNIRKTEVEHMRSFVSRTVDRARKAYGHFRVDAPRTPIFFATTNNDQYLKEADRRFWPVKTTTIDIEALKRDRDQLWAEASMQEPGTSIVLRQELWKAASVEQEAREEHDPWYDKLTNAVGTVEYGEERVSSTDLLETVLGIHVSKQRDIDYKRLGKCMRKLGWNGPKKTKIAGKDVKGYTRPDKG